MSEQTYRGLQVEKERLRWSRRLDQALENITVKINIGRESKRVSQWSHVDLIHLF